MDEKVRTSLSKFLSFVLRHEQGAIGVQLDHQGWIAIDTLLAQCRAHGKDISRSLLDEIVRTSPKRRFAISEDGRRIRASQGHSNDAMSIARYVRWQDGEMWLGYFEQFPDYLTEGECVPQL